MSLNVGNAQREGTTPHNIASFGMEIASDDGRVGFEDPCLFSGDFPNRIAKPLLVVESDGSDDADIGRNCVGRVEPPAHSGFENRNFTVFLLKMLHRQSKADFEKGRMRFPIRNMLANFSENASDVGLWNHFPTDAYSLAEGDEMRRSEEPSGHAGISQDALGKGANRAFAVGSCDMNDFQSLRQRKKGKLAEETLRIFQTQFDAEILRAVKPVDGFVVVHGRMIRTRKSPVHGQFRGRGLEALLEVTCWRERFAGRWIGLSE
jgi:hypothetical protein